VKLGSGGLGPIDAKIARRALQILCRRNSTSACDAGCERGKQLENGAGNYRDPLQVKDPSMYGPTLDHLFAPRSV